jgi:hypothetical protein
VQNAAERMRSLFESRQESASRQNPITDVLRTVDAKPALSAIDGLPPQAKRDLMHGTVAALTQDKPAPAMEMLRAGADGDARVAEAVHQIGDAAAGEVSPDEAWRALADVKSPEAEADAVASFRRAEDLRPPASVEASTEPEGEFTPLQRSAQDAVGPEDVERPDGGPEPEAPRPTSPATRAALEAERRAAADFELQASSFTDAERAQIDDVLQQIDLETADWRSLVDAGAACLASAAGGA